MVALYAQQGETLKRGLDRLIGLHPDISRYCPLVATGGTLAETPPRGLPGALAAYKRGNIFLSPLPVPPSPFQPGA